MPLETVVEKCESKVAVSSAENAVVCKQENLIKEEVKEEQPTDVKEQVVNEEKSLEEEEDVPSDFFDDFSDQDFMDGLDIVDTWEEKDVINDDQNDEAKEDYNANNKKINEKDSKLHNDKKQSGSNQRDDHYNKNKPRNRRNDTRKEHESSRSIKNLRRDPEKTKRDIQRDKDKCARDLETKVINEKLKVVETGLVPPGTEMDIDLSAVGTQADKPPKLKENVKTLKKGKSKSSDNHARRHQEIRQRTRSRSRERLLRISRERDRYRDDNRYLRRHSRSPRRSHSPYTKKRLFELSRERNRERYKSPRLSRERFTSREKYLLPNSGVKRSLKQRSNSPNSNISERELWLRNREARNNRRSKSPRYKKIRVDDQNKKESSKEKLSFLKEIREKLNETTHSPQLPNPMPSMQQQMFNQQPQIPMSLPPMHNQMFQPQMMPAIPTYDQNFFTGGPQVIPQSMCPPVYNMPSGVVMDPMYQTQPLPVPPPDISQASVNINCFNLQHNSNNIKVPPSKTVEIMDQDQIAKLFEDKKISLSDFLSITAKSTDSSQPINIQNKIKVISRCQEAIKQLGGNSDFSGRLLVRKTIRDVEKISDVKHQSPLRKQRFVRFHFTTPAKGARQKSSFSANLNKLVQFLGIEKEAELQQFKETSATPSISPREEVKEMRMVKSVANRATDTKISTDNLLGVKYIMKVVQTEPFQCQVCAIRNDTVFVDEAVQCDETLALDVGVQVSEADLLPKPKGILKNQSLAHLTPAQLLAQTKIEEFPSTKPIEKIPEEPGPSTEENNRSVENVFRKNAQRNERFDQKKLYQQGDRFLGERLSFYSNPRNLRERDDRFYPDERRIMEDANFSTADRYRREDLFATGRFSGVSRFSPVRDRFPDDNWLCPGGNVNELERMEMLNADDRFRQSELYSNPRSYFEPPKPQSTNWFMGGRRF